MLNISILALSLGVRENKSNNKTNIKVYIRGTHIQITHKSLFKGVFKRQFRDESDLARLISSSPSLAWLWSCCSANTALFRLFVFFATTVIKHSIGHKRNDIFHLMDLLIILKKQTS